MRGGVLILVLAALAVLAVAWSRRETMDAEPAIINGQPADFKRYPWFCHLQKWEMVKPTRGNLWTKQGFLCGGVLVSKWFVLSAGHCSTPTLVTVGGDETLKVKAFFKVPGPDAKDWMLVQLASPSKHTPIKLATQMPRSPERVTMLGQGTKQNSPADDSDLSFKKTSQWYMPNDEAIAVYRSVPDADNQYKRYIIDTLTKFPKEIGIVVSNKIISNSCFGDSGGPVIIERALGTDELLGITFSSSCTTEKTYNFTMFIKVPGYLGPLIKSFIAQNPPK